MWTLTLLFDALFFIPHVQNPILYQAAVYINNRRFVLSLLPRHFVASLCVGRGMVCAPQRKMSWIQSELTTLRPNQDTREFNISFTVYKSFSFFDKKGQFSLARFGYDWDSKSLLWLARENAMGCIWMLCEGAHTLVTRIVIKSFISQPSCCHFLSYFSFLLKGYIEAAVIPVGARRIKVVEDKPSHSFLGNYLSCCHNDCFLNRLAMHLRLDSAEQKLDNGFTRWLWQVLHYTVTNFFTALTVHVTTHTLMM